MDGIVFHHGHGEIDVDIIGLQKHVIRFLENYTVESLVGRPFVDIVKGSSGEARFAHLLSATGFDSDPHGFFSELIAQLDASGRVVINEITIPHLFLMSNLENLIPGNRFISINSVEQLERLTHVSIPEEKREELQNVIDLYPVRLSMHTIRQMRVSHAVAYQYLPFQEELNPAGHINTWIGQFHQGLLEQMYRNRVIFLLNMTCPVYCRFCFRKHKDSRNEPNPTIEDLKRAIKHVQSSPDIKEIVLTGGDPFLGKANLLHAVDGLMEIPHVQTLRFATRSIAYYPHFFYANDRFWLDYLKGKSRELQKHGKRMEVATHMVHPDEVSIESLEIISDLVNHGIAVYVQTPFLKDCNNEGPELVRLFSILRGAGAEAHYIYIPCSSIQGNSVYWTPISTGLDAASYLRAFLSDRAIPRICTATPFGKMDWHSSGWAVERDTENDHYIWIRTPYTPEYFKSFADLADDIPTVRLNDEGTLDARFMAQIGDIALFYGSRAGHRVKKSYLDKTALLDANALLKRSPPLSHSLVDTGSRAISRTHLTQVEVDVNCSDNDLKYVLNQDEITDVILTSINDSAPGLDHIAEIIDSLRMCQHVNALRLRGSHFYTHPEKISDNFLERLESLNRISVVHPLRLEIETQFAHVSEIKDSLGPIVQKLRNAGITIYNNTPLLSGINDTAEDIHQITYRCRELGLEFHHVYVAGLPVQVEWNRECPIDIDDVLDIGTVVRRNGSGREIPEYIIRTELGEVDFGLTCRFIFKDEQLWIKLLPYNLDYYRQMDPQFQWPAGIQFDTDGKPMIPAIGLTTSTKFMCQS